MDSDPLNILVRFIVHLLRGPFVALAVYFLARWAYRKDIGFGIHVWTRLKIWKIRIPLPGFHRLHWWRRLFGPIHLRRGPLVVLGCIWVPLFEFYNIMYGQTVVKAIWDWWSWPIALSLAYWGLYRFYKDVRNDISHE